MWAAQWLTAQGAVLFTADQVHSTLAAVGVVWQRATVADALADDVAALDGGLARARTGLYRLCGTAEGPEAPRPGGAPRRSADEHVRVALAGLAEQGRVRVTRRDVEGRLAAAGCPYSWRAVHGALRRLVVTDPDVVGLDGHGWYRVGVRGTDGHC